MKLLEAEVAIDPDCSVDNQLTQLQTKCIRSLVMHWKEFLASASMQSTLRNFRPFFQSTVLIKCLEQSREETEAFAALLDNTGDGLPASITVEGAGVAAVNGVYVRDAPFYLHNSKYCMNGVWEGGQATFFIYMVSMGPTKTDVWFISVEIDGEEDFDVYTAFLFSDRRLSSLPRMKGWEATEPINGPAPSLTYNFNE